MKKINVLLVDDDEINRLVACTFLKKWDVGVTVATQGREALDLIKDKSFQMVMMDLHMPEMDGYECTKQIRSMEDPYFKQVPIIVFSASYTIDTKKKAMEHGMTDFMNKPFRAEELLEKISLYTSYGQTSSVGRPLRIDFALHTDGDAIFKAELTNLLTESVTELKTSLAKTIQEKDAQPFLKTCHSVATALAMLNDPELSSIVDALRNHLKQGGNTADQQFGETVGSLDHIADALIESLRHESEKSNK
jgi:CheY-like chemotaxis protein